MKARSIAGLLLASLAFAGGAGAAGEAAPEILISSPADGFVTSQTALDIVVFFASKDLGEANVRDVDLLRDGEVVATFANAAQEKRGSHSFTVDLSALPDGTYTFQARAFQGDRKAGLVGTSQAVRVILDRTLGQGVLLVDDDGGRNLEAFFVQALEARGIPFRVHDVHAAGPPGVVLLNQFEKVVWTTGDTFFPALDAVEIEVLRQYLAGGGSLFLSSEGLAPDILFFQRPDAIAFARDFLHIAVFEGNFFGTQSVRGVAGDPIGDGLSLELDNPVLFNFADSFVPDAESAPVLRNAVSGVVASRFPSGDNDTFRVVYTSFPFEAIDPNGLHPNTQVELLGRVLGFLRPRFGVSQVLPPEGASGVATNAKAHLKLNGAVDPASVSPASVFLEIAGSPIPSLPILDPATDIVSLLPLSNLPAGTAITIVATPALRDAKGRSLEREFRAGFTTGAAEDHAPPAAPQGLQAFPDTVRGEQVVLSWSPNPEADLFGYQVFRKLSTQGDFAPIGFVLQPEAGFVDRDVVPGVEHAYLLKALDIALNVGDPSAEALATPLDNTPPDFQITSHANFQLVNTPSVALSGTIDDPDARITVDGIPGEGTVLDGIFHTQTLKLRPGPNALTLVAADPLGNVSRRTITLILDTTPPVAQITLPRPGERVGGGNVIVFGTATDPNFSSFVLEFGVGTNPAGFTEITQQFFQVRDQLLGSWNTFGVPDGDVTLRLRARDRAGSEAVASVPVVVDNLMDLPEILSHKSGAIVRDETPLVYGHAFSGAQVLVFLDGKEAARTTANIRGDFLVELPKVSNGTHALTARMVVGGQTSPPSLPITITVDTTPPSKHGAAFWTDPEDGVPSDPDLVTEVDGKWSLVGMSVLDDSFEGASLDPKWTRVRPPSAGFGVAGGEFFVRMDPFKNLEDRNDAPLFLQASPAGDFEASVKVRAQLSAPFQQGGLLIYENDDNYVLLAKAFIGSSPMVYAAVELDGILRFTNAVVYEGEAVFLKIRRMGANHVLEYSADGERYKVLGEVTADLNTRIGLTAFSDSFQTTTVFFDRFKVLDGIPTAFPSSSPEVLFELRDAGSLRRWDLKGLSFTQAGTGTPKFQYATDAMGTAFNGTWLTVAEFRAKPDATSQFFRLKAQLNSDGAQPLSIDDVRVPNVLVSSDTMAPGSPTEVTVTAHDSTVVLTWAPVQAQDVSAYKIIRVRGTSLAAGTERTVFVVDASTGIFIDPTAENGVTYTYALVACDEFGNFSPPSEERRTMPRQDATAPVLAVSITPLQTISGGLKVSRTATPSFEVTAEDLESGLRHGALAILLDGVDFTSRFILASKSPTSTMLRFTPGFADRLADGAHSFSVSAANNRGLVAQKVESFVVDTLPPQLLVISPGSGQRVTGDSLPLAVSYTDAGTGADTTTLSVLLDNTTELVDAIPISKITATQTVHKLLESDLKRLGIDLGFHTLRVTVSDNVGNAGFAFTSFHLAIPKYVEDAIEERDIADAVPIPLITFEQARSAILNIARGQYGQEENGQAWTDGEFLEAVFGKRNPPINTFPDQTTFSLKVEDLVDAVRKLEWFRHRVSGSAGPFYHGFGFILGINHDLFPGQMNDMFKMASDEIEANWATSPGLTRPTWPNLGTFFLIQEDSFAHMAVSRQRHEAVGLGPLVGRGLRIRDAKLHVMIDWPLTFRCNWTYLDRTRVSHPPPTRGTMAPSNLLEDFPPVIQADFSLVGMPGGAASSTLDTSGVPIRILETSPGFRQLESFSPAAAPAPGLADLLNAILDPEPGTSPRLKLELRTDEPVPQFLPPVIQNANCFDNFGGWSSFYRNMVDATPFLLAAPDFTPLPRSIEFLNPSDDPSEPFKVSADDHEIDLIVEVFEKDEQGKSTGEHVPDGTTVDWTADGDGVLVVASSTTTGGLASTALQTNTVLGTRYSVIAKVHRTDGSFQEGSVAVEVVPGLPASILFEPEGGRNRMPADLQSSIKFTITAKDRFDNAMLEGTPVVWEFVGPDAGSEVPQPEGGMGDFKFSEPATDGLGQARSEVVAPPVANEDGRPHKLRVTIQGVTKTFDVDIEPIEFEFVEAPAELEICRDLTATVRVRARGKRSGENVPDGARITWVAPLGSIRASNPVSEYESIIGTISGGEASANLATFRRFPAGNAIPEFGENDGVCKVSAQIGNNAGVREVIFLPLQPQSPVSLNMTTSEQIIAGDIAADDTMQIEQRDGTFRTVSIPASTNVRISGEPNKEVQVDFLVNQCPAARYPMDRLKGNVLPDVVGGHDGTLTKVTLDTTQFFQGGASLKFNGDGKVEVADAPALQIRDGILIEAAVRRQSFNDTLVAKGTAYALRSVGAAYVFSVTTGAGVFEVSSDPFFDAPWRNVSASYREGKLQLRVDGRRYEAFATGAIRQTADPLVMGEGFTGNLDNVVLTDLGAPPLVVAIGLGQNNRTTLDATGHANFAIASTGHLAAMPVEAHSAVHMFVLYTGPGNDPECQNKKVVVTHRSVLGRVNDLFAGFLWGGGSGFEGTAGDFAASVLAWGDIRDLAVNIGRMVPGGKAPNWTTFGFSVVGLYLELGPGVLEGPDAAIGAVKVMLKKVAPGGSLAKGLTNFAKRLLAGLAVKTVLEEAIEDGKILVDIFRHPDPDMIKFVDETLVHDGNDKMKILFQFRRTYQGEAIEFMKRLKDLGLSKNARRHAYEILSSRKWVSLDSAESLARIVNRYPSERATIEGFIRNCEKYGAGKGAKLGEHAAHNWLRRLADNVDVPNIQEYDKRLAELLKNTANASDEKQFAGAIQEIRSAVEHGMAPGRALEIVNHYTLGFNPTAGVRKGVDAVARNIANRGTILFESKNFKDIEQGFQSAKHSLISHAGRYPVLDDARTRIVVVLRKDPTRPLQKDYQAAVNTFIQNLDEGPVKKRLLGKVEVVVEEWDQFMTEILP